MDVAIPTDQVIQARRPDVVLWNKCTKEAYIIDMACTWESLIPEREKEKKSKYLELAADMGRREPRWQIKTMAVMVGTLGTLGSLRHQFSQLGIWIP